MRKPVASALITFAVCSSLAAKVESSELPHVDTAPIKKTNKSTSSELIVNGSFEQCIPDFKSDHEVFAAPSTNIVGWQVAGGDIDVCQGPKWLTPYGRRHLDLNGLSCGVLVQTFPTVPGTTYQLNFIMAGNPEGGPPIKSMYVRAAGQSKNFEFDTSGKSTQQPGWRQVTWEFVADKAKTMLELGSLVRDGWHGALIDNVSVKKLSASKGKGANATGEAPGKEASLEAKPNPKTGTNLIKNGSFEIIAGPATWTGEYLTLPAGSRQIAGWEVMPQDVNLFQESKWHMIFGRQSLELNGWNPGGVKQTIDTEPGATYLLKFWMCGNVEGGPVNKPLYVRAGSDSTSFTFNNTGRGNGDLGWAERSWKFVAKGPKTVMKFGTMVNSGGHGPIIDNVTCVKIADPVAPADAAKTNAEQTTPPPAAEPASDPSTTGPAGSTTSEGSPPSVQSRPDLVLNGSFELSPTSTGDCYLLPVNTTELSKWQVIKDVKLVLPPYKVAQGSKAIELNAEEPGIIKQDIATEPGTTYRVNFYASANPHGPAVKAMYINAGDESVSYDIDSGGSEPLALKWRPFSWSFVAKSDRTTLELGSNTPKNFGPFIDNVTVEKVTP